MKFVVDSQHITLSAARQMRLARMVRIVLGPLRTRVRSILLHISDEGGGNGGRTCCRITIDLSRYRVIARHKASSVSSAVLYAVKKAIRNLNEYRRRRALRRLSSKIKRAGMAAPNALHMASNS